MAVLTWLEITENRISKSHYKRDLKPETCLSPVWHIKYERDVS